jgi:serine/threonine protein kinase
VPHASAGGNGRARPPLTRAVLALCSGGSTAITLGAELGRGNYGRVHRAVLRPAAGSSLRTSTNGPLTVAVKVPVSPNSSPTEVDVERSAALLLEAFVMHGLKHPRIVSLVAVCTHTKPILICMEHMQNGDLKSFLRRYVYAHTCIKRALARAL